MPNKLIQAGDVRTSAYDVSAAAEFRELGDGPGRSGMSGGYLRRQGNLDVLIFHERVLARAKQGKSS